nr:hypothetical protein [uncultured Eisenbergiella sp.]
MRTQHTSYFSRIMQLFCDILRFHHVTRHMTRLIRIHKNRRKNGKPLLQKAIHGRIPMGRTAGIIYLIDGSGEGKELTAQEYLSFLEASSREGITLYAIEGRDSNQIDLMLTLDKDDILPYQPFLAGLQDRFTQRFSITATIGFGTIYPQLSLVSISYMQASQKIRGRSLKDDGKNLYHMEEDDGSRFYQQIRNYFPRFRSSALS